MPRSNFEKDVELDVKALAERSGVSVASIKFYLREGLLPPGDPSRPHRAYYDESHLRRLAIIRAMRDAGISIDAMRRALAAVSAPRSDVIGAIAPAIDALETHADGIADAPLRRARKEVAKLFAERKLSVRPEAGSRETIARALASLRRVDSSTTITALSLYLDALLPVAQAEIESEDTRRMLLEDKEGSLEIAVLGTVLYEPILLGLRRALHEHFATQLVRKKSRKR